MRGLSRVSNKLILCYLEEGAIEKHPFHIRLEALFKNVNDTVCVTINELSDLDKCFPDIFKKEKLIEVEEIPIPEATTYFYSNLLSNVTKREKESASSIEKFIQYPFDWVLENKLKMRAFQGLNLGRENQLKGNIAHKVIENLFNKRKSENFETVTIEENEFNQEFNKVVKQEGILFLQPEKRFELSEFRLKFKTSFYGLVTIINTNSLSILNCEYSFGNEEDLYFEEIDNKMGGYIDLLLKNSKGEFIVIDLKWTFSSKKFISKIEKNEAIQLAIYSAAIHQKDLAKTGYFLLSQNLLITASDLIGNNIERISSNYSNNEVLKKIESSVKFRWNELKSGKLEIGDTMRLDELEYTTQADLISLPETGTVKEKMKESNNYTGFELFKGKLN